MMSVIINTLSWDWSHSDHTVFLTVGAASGSVAILSHLIFFVSSLLKIQILKIDLLIKTFKSSLFNHQSNLLTPKCSLLMICKSVNKLHTSFLASTHTSDNYFKTPSSSQPRRGVHSWPAIQYCQRNLKFHPFKPPPSSLRRHSCHRLPPKYSTLLLLSSHMETVCTKTHEYTQFTWIWTGKPARCPLPARTEFCRHLYLSSDFW